MKSLHFCFHCSRDFFAQRGQRPALGFDISFIIVDPGGLEEAGYFADQLLFAVAAVDNPARKKLHIAAQLSFQTQNVDADPKGEGELLA